MTALERLGPVPDRGARVARDQQGNAPAQTLRADLSGVAMPVRDPAKGGADSICLRTPAEPGR